MPGQDCLVDKCFYIHDFKEAGVGRRVSRPRATTELMGVAGWQGLDPAFLKRSINATTAWGIGHVIPHGVFTTRKLDGNPWMPDFYSESPTFPWMHLWNEFTARACYINSLGHAVPDVLLYNPLESAWTLASADMLDTDMWLYSESQPEGKQINTIDRLYSKATQDLTAGRVEFLIGDRHYLSQMDVQDGRLVRGSLGVSDLRAAATADSLARRARKMLAFAKSGGRVYALAELPSGSVEHGMNDAEMEALMKELAAQPTFTQCPPEPADLLPRGTALPVGNTSPTPRSSDFDRWSSVKRRAWKAPFVFSRARFRCFRPGASIDGRDFFWLANNDAKQSQACEIEVSGVHGAASIWDCETRRSQTGSLRWTRLPAAAFHFRSNRWKPTGWCSIPNSRPRQTPPAKPKEQDIAAIDGPWTLTYDASIQPVMEHP